MSTADEFMAKVRLAEAQGVKEIEVPRTIIDMFCGKDYKEEFFTCGSIKVYELGKVDQAKKKARKTLEEINHGKRD